MNPQTKRNASLAVALLIGFVLACNSVGGGDETDKANKLVAEANTAIEAGNKAAIEAGRKNDRIFDEIKSSSFDEDKERLSATAKEAISGFTQSAERFREAARKFEEASKLKINDKFKEYLVLKSQEFNKNAEQVEAAKLMPQAVLDSEDAETLSQKVRENKARYDKLEKEAKELADKAEKVRAENKDKFQGDNSSK
ncbi:MAG TPA: hypothetical protein VGX92_07270 [Pyrinomonadaceae bacterium]|jgi:hypothetical protein|nr:hypothetical protein [Pyrinomonadaceae bacterium]